VLVFAGVNTLWYLFLFKVDYASDQEWHKYLVLMCVDILAQLLDVVLTLYFTAVQYLKAKDIGCYSTNKSIFIEIFCIICFNGVLVLVMAVSTFTLSI
jgi:hypothetical protein